MTTNLFALGGSRTSFVVDIGPADFVTADGTVVSYAGGTSELSPSTNTFIYYTPGTGIQTAATASAPDASSIFIGKVSTSEVGISWIVQAGGTGGGGTSIIPTVTAGTIPADGVLVRYNGLVVLGNGVDLVENLAVVTVDQDAVTAAQPSTVTFDADQLVVPVSPWTTGATPTKVSTERVAYYRWNKAAIAPLVTPYCITLPPGVTHVKFLFTLKALTNWGAELTAPQVAFKVITLFRGLRATEFGSESAYTAKGTGDPYATTNNCSQVELWLSIADLGISAEDAANGGTAKFWFGRDVGHAQDFFGADIGLYSVGITPITGRTLPSNTLKELLVTKMLAAVIARGPYANAKARFATKDNSGNGSFTMSSTRFDVPSVCDFSGTCVWNQSGAEFRGVTLISPDCFVMANHYPVNVGHTVRFVDSTGTVHNRTVTARNLFTNPTDIPMLDVAVGVLDSPLPASVPWYSVVSPSILDKVIMSGRGIPIVSQLTGQDWMTIREVQYLLATGLNPFCLTGEPSENSTFTSWYIIESTATDSGSPLFLLMPDNELVLLGWQNIGGGSTVKWNGAACLANQRVYDAVNSSLSTAGTSTQLTPYDFSSYPTLTGYGYA
jgi:hypothetical protein